MRRIRRRVAKPDLTRIGFFHFGVGHGEPIPKLTAALGEAEERYRDEGGVADSLIVLPEAFNIQRPYSVAGQANWEPTVLMDLGELSDQFRCAFIAGLIVIEAAHPDVRPPYNSAHLIDGRRRPPVSHKMKQDGTPVGHATGEANYTEWPSRPPIRSHTAALRFFRSFVLIHSPTERILLATGADAPRYPKPLTNATAPPRCFVSPLA